MKWAGPPGHKENAGICKSEIKEGAWGMPLYYPHFSLTHMNAARLPSASELSHAAQANNAERERWLLARTKAYVSQAQIAGCKEGSLGLNGWDRRRVAGRA